MAGDIILGIAPGLPPAPRPDHALARPPAPPSRSTIAAAPKRPAIDRCRRLEGTILARPHTRDASEARLTAAVPTGPSFAAARTPGRRQRGERSAELGDRATPAAAGARLALVDTLKSGGVVPIDVAGEGAALHRVRDDMLVPVGDTMSDRRVAVTIGMPS